MHCHATVSARRPRNEYQAATNLKHECRSTVSVQEDLFGDNQTQDLLQVRDAMNAQEEVPEPSMDDSDTCEQGQLEDGDTRVDEPFENQATDQEDSIIDETLNLSTVKDLTRSKSKKYIIPQAICPPSSEDKEPRPSRRKRAQRGASVSRAGVTAKFLRRKSNQFPSTASKKLNA